MSEKSVVIVISDLHLGGGASDPGDDHVYDRNQLRDFIQEHLLNLPEGQRGEMELFINGDFLEFAQVNQSAYRLASAAAWCSEDESKDKLRVILEGHADIFDALKRFSERGNLVTIAAGNHDVDLFWSSVQKSISEKAGNVQFVLGDEWASRFDGKLRLAHGHQKDLGNKFKGWSDPFVKGPDGKTRLEMCPGTLFMVKFINWLEEKYPFADNIKPIGALAKILCREDKLGSIAAMWMLTKFCALHPDATLQSGPAGIWSLDFPKVLVDAARANKQVGDNLRKWYRSYIDSTAGDMAIEEALKDEVTLKNLFMQVMLHEKPLEWKECMDVVSVGPGTLGEEDGTLQLALSRLKDEKEIFRDVARAELSKKEVHVVILGHTHTPDQEVIEGGKQYFNPGSWTRFADVSTQKDLKLDDLRDESKYPYQLNYIWVELKGEDVRGQLKTYRELKPQK